MNKKFFTISMLLIFSVFLSKFVSAHCPLCTIGAGAAAAGAVWLGVSKVVVALFMGGFAMSMGMWFSRIIQKQYIKFQKIIIVIVVFLTTLLPLMPLFTAIGPLYLSFLGTYGTTYAVNYSLGSSLLGGLIVFISPALSRNLSKLRRGKIIPYQGVIITLSLLVITGGIIQLLI